MAFNPLRDYRFRIEIDGIDQLAVQKVTIPERAVTVVEHGGYDAVIKTAGKPSYGNLTLEKLKPIDGKDLFSYEWFQVCIYGTPTEYKRNLVIKELGADGITTINTWILEGCFPITINQSDLDRMGEGNALETIDFSVDKVNQI